MKRNETCLEAVRREVQEEVGISIHSPQKIYGYINTKEYKIDMVEVFHADVPDDTFTIDGFEIAEAQWFAPDYLPNDVVPRVYEVVERYKKMIGV